LQSLHPYDEGNALRLIAEGDEAAFGRLYQQYREKVYYISWKLLKSETAAEDALQEVFAKIWNRRENLPLVENFNAYLNRVTRNHIFNMLRKKANEELFLKEMARSAGHSRQQDFNTLVLHELERNIKEAVEQLPPQQKKVFQLSRIYGLKQEEIAASMKISLGTVKKHMMMSLRSVKAYLGVQQNIFDILFILLLYRFF